MKENQKYFENSAVVHVATLLLFVIYFKLRSQCKRLHKEIQWKSKILEYIENETIQNKQIQFASIKNRFQAEMNFLDKRRICIKRALDSVPENIDLYNKLAKDLEEVENTYAIAQIMKEDKSDSERLHHLLETKRKILISDQCRQTKSIFELNKKQPFQYCPLENFIEKTPIEDVFWKTCSPDQINKLDEELIMLEGIYPLKPVTKLRRAIPVRNGWWNPRGTHVESTLSGGYLVVVDIEWLDPRGIHVDFKWICDEEVDCCSICFERYENGEVTRCLPCSHVFHSECIKEWKKNTCPVCRGSF